MVCACGPSPDVSRWVTRASCASEPRRSTDQERAAPEAPPVKLERAAAPGIHRIEDAQTNWYLIEDAGRLTVVDTGLPRSWGSLQTALRELGRSLQDIEAVVLTHAHFDHMGIARRRWMPGSRSPGMDRRGAV